MDKVRIGSRKAAEMLGVTPRTIQRWVEAGKLDGLKFDPDAITSPLMISVESVEALLAERYPEENDLS
jgi:transposase